MSDTYTALREALAAGPTIGPWISVHTLNEDYVYAPAARYPTLPGNPSPVKVAWLPPSPALPGIPRRDAAYIAAANPETVRALLAERDALAAEVAEAQEELRLCQQDAIKLQAECERLRADAERYRWLCANYARGDGYVEIDRALNDGDADIQLSPAIDAAREAANG